MAVIEGRTKLEVLSTIACDRHLRTETVGRIAVMVDDHPEIFPVNYAVDERGDIFFRTDPGTKLNAAATAPTIAFEIDGFDEDRELGWSVLAVGPARWLGRPQDIAKVREPSAQAVGCGREGQRGPAVADEDHRPPDLPPPSCELSEEDSHARTRRRIRPPQRRPGHRRPASGRARGRPLPRERSAGVPVQRAVRWWQLPARLRRAVSTSCSTTALIRIRGRRPSRTE